ncbi:MAG TPA: hypothetical protein VFV54_05780, partial [Thermoanaerobaculia bacterium]|nr:hypothetical protein [Thermoanaerobaculia bacterium]
LQGVGYRLIVAGERSAPARRSWTRVGFAVVLLGVLAGAALIAVNHVRSKGLGREGERPLEVRRLTSLGTVVQAFISPDGNFLLYGINEESRSNELWLQQIGAPGGVRLLSTGRVGIFSAQFTKDGKFIYYALDDREAPPRKLYRMPVLGGDSTLLLAGIESGKVAFSPDGSRFAYLRDQFPKTGESSLIVANADGSNSRIIATLGEPESFATFFNTPSWSPNGRWIAVGSRRAPAGVVRSAALLVMRPDGSGRRVLSQGAWTEMGQTEWLPDSSGILAIAVHQDQPAQYRQIWLFPFPGGSPERITNDLLVYRSLSLSADGSRLVTVFDERSDSLWVVSLEGKGAPVPLSSARDDGTAGIASAPGGEVVLSRFEEGAFRLYRRDAEGGVRRIPLGTIPAMWPAVSHDGRLAFQSAGGTIHTARLDGSDRRRLTLGARPTFTPDGRFVVFQRDVQGGPALFRISTDGGVEVRLTDYPAVRASVSPAGDALAAVCRHEGKAWRLCVIPIDGGLPSRTFPIDFEPYRTGDVEWMPDGDGILLSGSPSGGDWKNVYLQPTDGSEARRLTEFSDFGIHNFAVSSDGRALLIVRGWFSRDAMLITGLVPQSGG